MAIDREARSLEIRGFAGLLPPQPPPPRKPLNIHVARAAANNLTLNVVNVNFEIRNIVVAQGIEFHNFDIDERFKFFEKANPPGSPSDVGQFTIPQSLQLDFPDLILQDDTNAVFISDAQHVEFHIRVVKTKDEFKAALETPAVHVVYCGHARWGRGPCFGPDIGFPGDKTGDNWEDGVDPVKFGLYRMGHPFVGVPFSELEEHKYRMRPVPTTVKVNPADIDGSLTNRGSLRPLLLRGSRFEPFIQDLPIADSYWGCRTVEGDGLLLFADFQSSRAAPMDLGATDLRCRCLTVIACETFDHFHSILRRRKGFTRTDTEGFAYFTTALSNARAFRIYLSSLLEFPERNDFKSWFPALEFAAKRSNQKLAAMGEKYKII